MNSDNSELRNDMIDAVNRALTIISRAQNEKQFDQRRLALAKTNIEQGMMWFESAETLLGSTNSEKE